MQSQASFNMQVIVLVTVCLLIKPNKQKYFSLKRPGYIAMHQFFFYICYMDTFPGSYANAAHLLEPESEICFNYVT